MIRVHLSLRNTNKWNISDQERFMMVNDPNARRFDAPLGLDIKSSNHVLMMEPPKRLYSNLLSTRSQAFDFLNPSSLKGIQAFAEHQTPEQRGRHASLVKPIHVESFREASLRTLDLFMQRFQSPEVHEQGSSPMPPIRAVSFQEGSTSPRQVVDETIISSPISADIDLVSACTMAAREDIMGHSEPIVNLSSQAVDPRMISPRLVDLMSAAIDPRMMHPRLVGHPRFPSPPMGWGYPPFGSFQLPPLEVRRLEATCWRQSNSNFSPATGSSAGSSAGSSSSSSSMPSTPAHPDMRVQGSRDS